MNIAIYRIHYGLDFLDASIKSIWNHVDKIYVFYSTQPWVVKPTVNYLGEEINMIPVPEDVLAHMEKNYKFDLKVRYVNRECSTPLMQFRHLYDKAIALEGSKPDTALFMEPDMIFMKKQIEYLYRTLCSISLPSLSSTQVEIWRLHEKKVYRIPYRCKAHAVQI